MKIPNIITALATAVALSASAGMSAAAPLPPPVELPQAAQPVAADCNSLARQMAQQYGGRARASVQNRGGGQRVCVVVVVVEGKQGNRGQQIRREFPLN